MHESYFLGNPSFHNDLVHQALRLDGIQPSASSDMGSEGDAVGDFLLQVQDYMIQYDVEHSVRVLDLDQLDWIVSFHADHQHLNLAWQNHSDFSKSLN
jgi:hypothetical protein